MPEIEQLTKTGKVSALVTHVLGVVDWMVTSMGINQSGQPGS